MDLFLVPDENPRWTQERLDHVYRFWDHYFNGKKPNIEEWYRQLGQEMPRRESFRLLRIENSKDHKHLGDLTVQRPLFAENGLAREIDITVFEEFQNLGVANKVLAGFLKRWEKYRTEGYVLEARIYNHEDRNKVNHLLEKNGFSVVQSDSDQEIIVMRYPVSTSE
jgi:hypothetical protein